MVFLPQSIEYGNLILVYKFKLLWMAEIKIQIILMRKITTSNLGPFTDRYIITFFLMAVTEQVSLYYSIV